MVGITSYGAYIPRYRLPRLNIYMSMGWFNPVTMSVAQGEKAVANYDQDSLTMAVEASINCLKDFDRSKIDKVLLASTTLPYKERQNTAIIATALNLRKDVRSVDVTDGLKAGTTALLEAVDSVKSGSASNALVGAADCRIGKLASMQEMFFGDGAAAVTVGSENVIAEVKGSFSLTYDFADHYRDENAKFDRTWEERWIRDEGFSKFIPEAINGLLKKLDMSIGDFAKVVFPCHFSRVHKSIGKKLGAAPEVLVPNFHEQVGDTGAAHSLLQLAAALEESNPGDKILVASFGSGAEAVCLEVTDAIKDLKARKGVKDNLEKKAELASYQKYCVFRDIIPVELGIRGEMQPASALTSLWRNRDAVFGMVGSKCTKCGTPAYPPQRICPNPDCGAVDKFEDYVFADKGGKIFTYTGDMLSFSFDPPQIYGLVDFDGGGRAWLDFTDCALDSLKVHMPFELSFRRKYADKSRGIHGYTWKVVPITD